MIPKFYFFLSGHTSGGMYDAMINFNTWTNACYFLSFIAAVGFVMIRKRVYWIALLIPAFALSLLFNANTVYSSLIGVFLPTIIHVYFFTLIFMAYGAKKSKSGPGLFSVVLALIIPAIIFGVDIPGNAFQFSDWMKATYISTGMYGTPLKTAQFFGWKNENSFYFNHTLELKLMTFLSFIYLYHYLNWFSKTSLIQWHKSLTLKRSILIAGTWAALLLLLYVNFQLGLWIAILFSTIHVILEFPLNILSIKGLFTKN
jgi:hypothetical protein